MQHFWGFISFIEKYGQSLAFTENCIVQVIESKISDVDVLHHITPISLKASFFNTVLCTS